MFLWEQDPALGTKVQVITGDYDGQASEELRASCVQQRGCGLLMCCSVWRPARRRRASGSMSRSGSPYASARGGAQPWRGRGGALGVNDGNLFGARIKLQS